MRFRVLTAIVLLGALSGCVSQYYDIDTLGAPIREIHKMPVEKARTFFSNKTIMTYDGEHRVCYGGMFIGQYYIPDCRTVPGHGTQVEYYAPNGLAFLWYPGNHRPVPSRWKLEHKKNIYGTYLYAICFLYPSRSYNPLTHESGGDWECDELGH
jgi:hypothetical protein